MVTPAVPVLKACIIALAPMLPVVASLITSVASPAVEDGWVAVGAALPLVMLAKTVYCANEGYDVTIDPVPEPVTTPLKVMVGAE